MTEAQFKQKVCDEVKMLLDCSKLYIDVKNYPSFAAVTNSNPISNGNLVNNFTLAARWPRRHCHRSRPLSVGSCQPCRQWDSTSPT